jgi:hypothetical protein
MKTCTSRIAGALLATAIPLAAGAADTPSSADAVIVAQATSTTAPAQGCPGDAGLSSFERRLLAKYDQDAQSLLSFVWRTRNIYLLERGETLLWAESYRQRHPAC